MNQRAKFIGIDVGTSGCKGLVLDEKGKILAKAYVEYPLLYKQWGIEQSPLQLWQAVERIITKLESTTEPDEIKGIGITSQGITFIPVDGKGKPLSDAISWLDTRATEELKEILKEFSPEEIFHLTGKRAEAYYVLPKLLWLMKNQPHIYEKTSKFLLVADYINLKLTGEIATDHTLASGTLLHNVRQNKWSNYILEKFAINPANLPSLHHAGEVTGYWKRIPVTIAGQDQKCAAYAVGLRTGKATISLGTASAITTLVEKPVLDAMMRIPLFPYIIKNSWVLEGVVSTAGAAYDWAKKTLKGKLTHQLSADKIRNLPFFLPHLSGASSPLWREDIRGSFHNISLSTTPEEMLLCILEGVCFEIRKNIEVIEELVGEIEEIIVFGGGAKNKVWLILLANSLGRNIIVPRIEETTAYGAALLAGKAMGVLKEEPLTKVQVIECKDEMKAILEERFQKYLLYQE
ncbi:hypothetical protein H5T87_04700 [bacterium]|nr:hypothetical protein [bacterium]